MKIRLSQRTALLAASAVLITFFTNTARAECVPLNGATPIRTADELLAMRSAASGSYYLCNDISFLGATIPPAGPILEPGEMNATFEGANHTISDFSADALYYAGLFDAIGPKGIVRNLTIVNAGVSGFFFAGPLAGYNRGVLNNVTVIRSTVSGNELLSGAIGGLVGSSIGSLTNCSVVATTVSGASQVGGIAGVLEPPANAKNLIASVSVSGTAFIGGLFGLVQQAPPGMAQSRVMISKADGTVSGTSNIGGLIGTIDSGTISYTTAEVEVSGVENVGGLVGASGANIIDSSARGSVEARGSSALNIGGLVGLSSASIARTYSSGAVMVDASLAAGNRATVGGIVGAFTAAGVTPVLSSYFNASLNPTLLSDNRGMGVSDDDLRSFDTYGGWNISSVGSTALSVWKIEDQRNYPYLRSIQALIKTSGMVFEASLPQVSIQNAAKKTTAAKTKKAKKAKHQKKSKKAKKSKKH